MKPAQRLGISNTILLVFCLGFLAKTPSSSAQNARPNSSKNVQTQSHPAQSNSSATRPSSGQTPTATPAIPVPPSAGAAAISASENTAGSGDLSASAALLATPISDSPSLATSTASPSLAPSPDPSPAFSSEIELGGGVLMPQSTYKGMPMSVQISYLVPVSEKMLWGPTARYTSGEAKETVDFATTGYTENRSYKVISYSVGAQAKTHVSKSISLAAQVGICLTESTLSQVETTAPLPSSLVSGTKKMAIDAAYGLGLRYDYAIGKSTIGAEFGYIVTASSEPTAMRGLYVGVIYTFGPQRVPPPEPTPEPSPSPNLVPSEPSSSSLSSAPSSAPTSDTPSPSTPSQDSEAP